MPTNQVLFSLSFCSIWALLLAEFCNGMLLDLPAGFNLSVRAALSSHTAVIKAHSSVDGHSFFVPFLSSSSFNSSSSSESLGFAVGFFFLNESSVNSSLRIDRQQLKDGIYLAVCGGMLGNHSNLLKGKLPFLNGIHEDAVFNASLDIIADGYVVPLWIAKENGPLQSLNASLYIVETQGGSNFTRKYLRLQDYDGRGVWEVSNAGMMEMQDSGNLVIYDSKNKTYVMWESNSEPTNTLVQGQKLLVGMEITSTNGDYSARMEKGGLVLVLNNVQLVYGQSSPYWIFPIHFRNDTPNSNGTIQLNSPNYTSVNSLISSSPCANSNVEDQAFAMLRNSSLKLFLETGSCSKDPSFLGAQRAFIAAGRDADFPISWSFLSLENDGRLYMNAVIKGNSTVLAGTPSTLRYALDNEEAVFTVEGSLYNLSIALQEAVPFTWGGCDVPAACGPLGMCTPQHSGFCSCPSSIEIGPINSEDSSQGCQLYNPLPACTNNVYTGNVPDIFKFIEIQASSILLLSDWDYAADTATVDRCKKACSSNCSCIGFFYNKETSNCFFINSSKISFINSTSGASISLVDLSKMGYAKIFINTSNHITYLKVDEVVDLFASLGNVRENLIIFATTLAVLLLIVLPFCCCCCCYCIRARRRWRRKQRNRQIEEEELRDILPLLPSRFSYKELQEATNGFNKLLGAGGCGYVYAGVLSDGRKVAVKLLESQMPNGQSKQFLAEVATIGRTNHLNVVRLVGFCWEDLRRLLVYEFVEKGSLDQWLFTEQSGTGDNATLLAVLDWQTRYDVALGVVRGLSYLHEECEPPVLHFDIKPQNILLDEAFVAKLADFGMSRLMQRGLSKVVTGVRGTPGYIAPEWLAHGAVSKKSDVYSMGMVFLEIVGGRKNVDLALLSTVPLNGAKNEAWHFPSWAAKKCEEGSMMELVDQGLHTSGFDVEQARKLIHTAFWCIQDDPSLRPNAPTVLQWLEGGSSVKQPPFNSISTSAHARRGSFTLLSEECTE
ncbi:hypothetical protein GOP47_0029614 [Adiantum capillus-veneris]|nr:hypothetical protein GOP47_0029614 [Adiantum capillus-veneris]